MQSSVKSPSFLARHQSCLLDPTLCWNCSKRDTEPLPSPSGTASGKVFSLFCHYFLSFHHGQCLFCQLYLKSTGSEHPREIWLPIPICTSHTPACSAKGDSRQVFCLSPSNHTGAPNPPKWCSSHRPPTTPSFHPPVPHLSGTVQVSWAECFKLPEPGLGRQGWEPGRFKT